MAVTCRVQFSPWDTLQTTVGVTVKGAEVTDVYGKTFPTYTNTSTIDHRYPHQLRPCTLDCKIRSLLPCEILGDILARMNVPLHVCFQISPLGGLQLACSA